MSLLIFTHGYLPAIRRRERKSTVSRKKLVVLAVLTALFSFVVLSGSASAASVLFHTGSQVTSHSLFAASVLFHTGSQVTSQPMHSASRCNNPYQCPYVCNFRNCPPEGSYDTSVTFCDRSSHSWWNWSSLSQINVTWWDAGSWNGRRWQSYDVVISAFGGSSDAGLAYRWC